MGRPIRVCVVIPESEAEALSQALILARKAPILETRRDGQGSTQTAIFPDLDASLATVVPLIGELTNVPGARVTINEREVSSLNRFWTALLCYRESLAEPNPHDHCLRFSARLNEFGGCPDQTCLSPCQFLCTRCIGLTTGKGGRSLESQLRDLARQAEVDWCPNLGFSGRLPTSDTRQLPERNDWHETG